MDGSRRISMVIMITMIKPFFKLIRIHNLLIVALTQYLMRWCVIHPILKLQGAELLLPEFDFFLLVLATVLITASGYVINDYFDRKSDLINRPDSVVVDIHIRRRWVIILHSIFNVISVLLALWISIKIGHWKFSLLFFLTSGILWFYSTSYKKVFLAGNIVVATLTALVPALVAIYELPLHYQTYPDLINQGYLDLTKIKMWIFGFSTFAFLTTLIREFIKDIEDAEGDYEIGRSTIPIVIGVKNTKYLIAAMIIITILALLISYNVYISDSYSLYYFVLFLFFPYIMLMNFVFRCSEREQYHKAGLYAKLIMLSGLLYAVIIPILYYVNQQT
jgi:4-hydroxybenzoate polyprenyltransferase